LKVLIPLLISYLFGAIIGQVAYSSMKDNAMIFPFLLTGSLAIAYLLLPVVKQAKDKITQGFKDSFFEERGKDQTEILPNAHTEILFNAQTEIFLKPQVIKKSSSDQNDNASEDVIIM
jgi:hypothetical protein